MTVQGDSGSGLYLRYQLSQQLPEFRLLGLSVTSPVRCTESNIRFPRLFVSAYSHSDWIAGVTGTDFGC